MSGAVREFDLGRQRMGERTIYLGTRMDDTAGCVGEHGVHTAIFLTEMRLVMLPFFEVVYLHATVTLRGEHEGAFIVESKGRDGSGLRRLPRSWNRGLTQE